ncbi:MAG: hydroxysqualene dehydroxylase HpnE [Castellaniella sp.]
MKLAVVGAGWSGLAAAVQAADLGHEVNVFEAAAIAGGRARRVHAPRLDIAIDNGQHLMLGAYTQCLALMARLGVDAEDTLHMAPLALCALDGSFVLRLPALPHPWQLVAGLLRARGLGAGDKLRLARSLHRLQRAGWRTATGASVQDWLDGTHQGSRAQQRFWHPLCLAAMNTPPAQACAQLFANVLRDSLGAGAPACRLVLPRVDLSSLWPERVAGMQPEHPEGRIKVHHHRVIRDLALTPDGQVVIEGETYDGAILACGPHSAHRLLKRLPGPLLDTLDDGAPDGRDLAAALAAFEHRPIATATLALDSAWALPAAMLMLREDRARQAWGQWLFHTPHYLKQAQPALLHVVISDAAQALERGHDGLLDDVQRQIRAQAQGLPPMPGVTARQLIVEKRATFAALPGLHRPGAHTPWQRLWLAGDWTDTGWPAVLEGAVRSGQAAARCAHQALAAM